MGRGVWVALAALAAALGLGGATAGASPFWTSDQVRQARPAEAEADALVFDLRRERTIKGKPTEVTPQTVALAPSFQHITEGDKHTLEDEALCSTLIWTERAASFQSVSCYAFVAFRLVEIQNRAVLSQIMAKAGSNDQALSLALAEGELGVTAPQTRPLEVKANGEAREYRFGKTLVARVSGSAGELAPAEMRQVTRFLARYVNLHPQARRDVAGGGRLPARIEVETGPMTAGDIREVLTITNLRHARVAYPLPAGLEPAVLAEARAGTTPRGKALARAAAALASGASGPSVEETLAAIRAAAAQGRGLEGMLLFTELTQEHAAALKPGPDGANPVIAAIRPLLGQLRGAPDAEAFIQANSLAGDGRAPGDRQAAARFLATHDMDAIPFGTFRYVTYANLVAVSAGAKDWDPKIAAAMPAERVDNYWRHIAAYPWSSNAYKDAGDYYYSGYEMGDAWLAFDAGRAIDPAWRDGPMRSVADYEARVRAGEPDFF